MRSHSRLTTQRRTTRATRSSRPKYSTRVGFNYRRLPAVSLLKEMVESGELGEIRLWRGTWLSDEFVDPAIPFDWRFEAAMGGTTICDLGSHLVDMATWMLGPIAEVSATSGHVREGAKQYPAALVQWRSTTPPRRSFTSARAHKGRWK